MVDKEVVVKTIKKMIDSGIDDSVILNTLADLGLSSEDSQELLSSAKEGSSGKEEKEIDEEVGEEIPEAETKDESTEEDIEEENDSDSYDIDSVIKKTSAKMKEQLAEKDSTDSLREQTTQLKLEEQDGKLDEIHQKISSLHGSVSSQDLTELKKKVFSMEKDVTEIKKDLKEASARINAMHDIMKKILETNRKILTKR